MPSKNPVALKIGRRAGPIPAITGWMLLLLVALAAVGAGRPWAWGAVEPVEAAVSLQTPPSPGGGQGAAGNCLCQGCKECESQVKDAREDLETRIDKDRQDGEGRIDKWMGLNEWILAVMITVFGFLLPLLGGLAVYFQLKQARDDAKDQVESLRKKIKDLEEEYRENFPQFSAMDERIQELLGEIKLRLPSLDDFNSSESFQKMPEIDRQYILDSELTVAAISVFGLDKSPSLRARISFLYGRLAQFYNLRDKASKKLTESSDFIRAVSYASRVIKLDRASPEGYRMRGAIYLDRYRFLKWDLKSTDTGALEELLKAAEIDLDEAVDKCTSEEVDAGAYYNRALAHFYREDYEKAAAVSKRLLGQEDKISPAQRERFLPSIYVNLGSFLAKRAIVARTDGHPDEERQFSSQAVQAITRGVRDFEQTTATDGGLERLKKALESELRDRQELGQLGEPYIQQLWELVKG